MGVKIKYTPALVVYTKTPSFSHIHHEEHDEHEHEHPTSSHRKDFKPYLNWTPQLTCV